MSDPVTEDGLRIDGLGVRLGDVVALDGVSLAMAPGEHVAVIGPSGSGKTTLLRAVAGLQPPTSGTVAWGDEVWSGNGSFVPPRERRIGMVAQDLSLWPHLDARGHLLLALKLRGVPKARRSADADALLESVGLAARETHRPAELSGGEGQRLALARALAGGSRLLLLDEPLGQLDIDLRESLGRLVTDVAASMGASVLHVTHDPGDAFGMADRILVLEGGRATQLGSPADLREIPATGFVERVVRRGDTLSGS